MIVRIKIGAVVRLCRFVLHPYMLEAEIAGNPNRLRVLGRSSAARKKREFTGAMGWIVLRHQAQRDLCGHVAGQPRKAFARSGKAARQYQMSDDESSLCRTVSQHKPVSDLPVHFKDGSAGPFYVVAHSGEPGSYSIGRILEIRQIQIHHTIQHAEYIDRIIRIRVVHKWQRQTSRHRESKCFDDLGHDV